MTWIEQRISDFAEVITGGTPSTGKSEYWDQGEIPWLNSGEVNQEIITTCDNYITEEGLRNSAAKLMPKDTVLIALTGATTGVVGYLTFEACANQSVTGILPSHSHHPKYLYYYLKSIRNKVLSDSYGGAQKHISQGYVKDLQIPLPPLPVQQRIAAILDAADALRRKDQELLKKYDELAQAIFIDMFGDPVKNEKGWEVKRLYEACQNIVGGGTPSKSNAEFYVGNIPWVTPKDMKSELISNSIDHINQLAVDNSSTKLIPKNSVLMVIRSGILKHTLPLAINTEVVTINQDMKAFILNEKYTNEYFFKYFLSRVSEWLLGKVRAVTADNIEFGVIRNMDFICPPLKMQNEFKRRILTLNMIKKQEGKYLADQLFQTLCQEAFKGTLVM
jgi:type I restriction enzyme S subunit